MKTMLPYIKKNLKFYSIAVFILLVSIIIDMYNPKITQLIIDDVIKGGQYDKFKGLIITFVIIILLRSFLGYFRELFFDYAGTRVVFDIRTDLFSHIQKLSFEYFDGMNTGEIMSRIKEDGDNIWKGASFGIMLTIDQGFYFIIASIMLFTISIKLAIVCILVMPIIAYLAMNFEKRIGKVYGKISDQTAQMNTIAQENISGVRLVKAFARERYEIGKFLKQNKRFNELNNEQADVMSDSFPKIEFISNIMIVIVVVFGGLLVVQEDLTLGQLIQFSAYINMMIIPMRMIGWIAGIMAQTNASIKKIEKIFKAEPSIKEVDQPTELSNCRGNIEFKNVSFSYDDKEVLHDISFKIDQGQTVAIMGRTGSGKSSLIHLMGRFYDTDKGQILIDGKDIKNLTLKSLREQFAYVMQDVFLFSDTISENLIFGKPHSSEEEMVEGAKQSDVHSFVNQMQEKYETIIGERGLGLSGGQKQRISIGRAFISGKAFLVLDDATSALDMSTEQKIQDEIKQFEGMTKFIIAHRISAAKDADLIIILEKGEIVERGTHEQLLEKEGLYHEIFQQQYANLI